MAFEGLDPVEVKQLATTLDAGANQIEEIRRLITGQLHFGAWEGADADQMRHEWDSYYASALSACEQALHTLAARARANADAQVEVSNIDGDISALGTVLGGLLGPTVGELAQIEKDIEKGFDVSALLDSLGQVIPDGKLVDLAKDADAFHGVFKFVAPIALAFDVMAMHDDVVDHNQNALAYDEVVTGLDTVSTAIMVGGLATGPGAIIAEPVADGISIAAGVMSVVGMYSPAKDIIGGGIRLYEKPFIDDAEDPFRNPLETAGSLIINPQIAAPAIAVGVVHDGVKLLSKIF
jgi:hypothetical protein